MLLASCNTSVVQAGRKWGTVGEGSRNLLGGGEGVDAALISDNLDNISLGGNLHFFGGCIIFGARSDKAKGLLSSKLSSVTGSRLFS